VKRRRKSGWDIDRRSIEAEWEAEILREEIAFWSWPDTAEGQLWIEISDKLEDLMKDVGIDPEERKLIWQTPSDWTLINPFGASINSILAFQETISRSF
jgi:hypothetical protein